MALGKTAFPIVTGAADRVGAVAGDGAGVGADAGAAAVAGAGAAVASPPHWVLRKSFHFTPLSVPAFLAA